MYTIVGYTRNSGTFNKGQENEREWVNYTLHCTSTPATEVKNLFGSDIKDVKVSSSVMQDFSDEVGGDIIGQNVNFEFELRNYNGVDKIITIDIIPVE